MNIRKHLAGAIAVASVIAAYPQISAAETFKSSDFLKWSRESQRSYFHTAIGMAGLISHMNDKAHARCVENWYFKNKEGAESRIRSTMALYPNDHPRGLIVALLQKECGSFNYSER